MLLFLWIYGWIVVLVSRLLGDITRVNTLCLHLGYKKNPRWKAEPLLYLITSFLTPRTLWRPEPLAVLSHKATIILNYSVRRKGGGWGLGGFGGMGKDGMVLLVRTHGCGKRCCHYVMSASHPCMHVAKGVATMLCLLLPSSSVKKRQLIHPCMHEGNKNTKCTDS